MSNFPFDVQIQDGEEYQTTTAKLHRIGQRGATEDGRVFRYCRCDDTYEVDYPSWAACCTYSYNTTDLEDCVEGSVVTAAVIGGYTLDTLDSGTHGADFFAEGYAALTVGSVFFLMRIKANTAAGASTTLTLYDPLPIDVAAASQIQIFPSVYASVASAKNIQGLNDPVKPKVCVPLVAVADEKYFWGQTWGPCYGVPSETFPRGTNMHDLQFNSDGSVTLQKARTTESYYQRAGYRLFDYTADPTGALILYQLELAP